MAEARSALKRLKETRSAPGRGPTASSNTNSGASVILFGFVPPASTHLLDCAPQVGVESATRPSIVAQAFKFDSDPLRFSNESIGIVAQNGVRRGRGHKGGWRGGPGEETRIGRSCTRRILTGRFFLFCLATEDL